MRDPQERLRGILEAIAAIERHARCDKKTFENDELIPRMVCALLADQRVMTRCKRFERKMERFVARWRRKTMDDDGEPFDEKMRRLAARLEE